MNSETLFHLKVAGMKNGKQGHPSSSLAATFCVKFDTGRKPMSATASNTQTGQLLRNILATPLSNVEVIEARLDAVETGLCAFDVNLEGHDSWGSLCVNLEGCRTFEKSLKSLGNVKSAIKANNDRP